ncbi:uncharacterized protein GGS22DRAFT_190252 [Annulohypoxylon maeteangense]|uniref:uncharacterized protein n=1 Tax=Annulohypoxylon maeteangense TaxID=1927788 RepID=UPI002007B2F5|nr:uncharacterized protein GGS22DRAFT_190252 [Annulohypoxylon maeteangense]KAI0883593.1 hypothetical protein GGS22DRAFT_190252 [Annulohypoxylon maeteangense]
MNTTKISFSLDAPPGTDIWRKPPSTNVFNAPITNTVSGPLKKFQSARVTFWAEWTERYDQAGLLLVPKRLSDASVNPPEKWIKTGIEFYLGQPQLSTVGCDRWADWSVAPLILKENEIEPAKAGGVTIEIVREGDELGKSLWVYRVVSDKDGSVVDKIPLREICWVLADEDEAGGEEWTIDVSPLVARPGKDTADSLSVDFKLFEVQWLP